MPSGADTHTYRHANKQFQETRRVRTPTIPINAQSHDESYSNTLQIANNYLKQKIVDLQKFLLVEIVLYTLY